MNDVVERILDAYQSMCPLDAERAADSRQKISRYIESLASAGQRDAEQDVQYGCRLLFNARLGVTGGFSEVIGKLMSRSLVFDWRGWFLIGVVLGGTVFATVAGEAWARTGKPKER